ncbi:hypothetical protein Lal_00000949 [Lupinus albus]|nr:hypothetical protein Lal_00000949 [Lupinus albus]
MYRWITKADFRPCSTGGSCSQAPFCPCTRGPISVWPEETFARLRYLLGGLRPIETVPWPVGPDTSGISLMARAPPEGGLLRPPPKLRRKSPKPIPGNSEAS